MKNYRLFVLGFVTISLVLLTGFKRSDVHDALFVGKQPTLANVKEAQFSSKESLVKLKQHKSINKHSIAKDSELQTSLDLTIPFKASEKSWLKIERNRIVEGESLNMFATEKQKKLRPVDLDGQMLMSQEPEVDKRKSLDGAGIVFTLKR